MVNKLKNAKPNNLSETPKLLMPPISTTELPNTELHVMPHKRKPKLISKSTLTNKNKTEKPPELRLKKDKNNTKTTKGVLKPIKLVSLLLMKLSISLMNSPKEDHSFKLLKSQPNYSNMLSESEPLKASPQSSLLLPKWQLTKIFSPTKIPSEEFMNSSKNSDKTLRTLYKKLTKKKLKTLNSTMKCLLTYNLNSTN
jgi:hypothetical protein